MGGAGGLGGGNACSSHAMVGTRPSKRPVRPSSKLLLLLLPLAASASRRSRMSVPAVRIIVTCGELRATKTASSPKSRLST